MSTHNISHGKIRKISVKFWLRKTAKARSYDLLLNTGL